MTSLADLYKSAIQRSAIQRQPGMAGTSGAPAPLHVMQPPTPINGMRSSGDARAAAQAAATAAGRARIEQMSVPLRAPAPIQLLQPGVSAGPAMQQQQGQSRPSVTASDQAAAGGMTPQQLAVIDAVQKQMAQQAAARQAAYAATPAGQTQAAIANNGVFAGRQAPAAAPTSGPQQLPPLQTTRGLPPMAGVR